jgi:hypothetical protein
MDTLVAQDSSGTRSLAWWPGLVALGAIALYWRALSLGFAGDDALLLYHLKRLGGLAHPAAYFTALDFFSYFRPVGFLTFALDGALWHLRPGGFHLTNLLLHAANGALVFVLGRRIFGSWGAALASALFVAHVSNQEAVYWISARFDLLATFFALVTILLATRRDARSVGAGLITFALALLCKESALAAPIIVGAYLVFVDRASARRVTAVLALMAGVIVAYAATRSAVAGLDPTGGTARLPKAVALFGSLAALGWLARVRWQGLLDRLSRTRPFWAVLGGGVLLGAAAYACTFPGAGTGVREKLSFAGFAGFYLGSPVVAPVPPPFFLDPTTPVYWVGGLAVLAVAGGILLAGRRAVAADPHWVFLAIGTVGALLPVSSLTEGQRYMYLASVGWSLAAAKLAVASTGRARRAVLTALGVVLVVSVWQVQVKGADWAWATTMASDAAALVNQDLPACDHGDVVFLVAPVGIRGVYSHFYHQTFSENGGCEPGSYQAVVRMVRTDQPVDVRWTGPRTVVVRAPRYRGNFVLSRDFHQFDVEQRSRRHARFSTPFGVLMSGPDGPAQVVTLELAPEVDIGRLRFYYFSEGVVRRAPPAPGTVNTPSE